LPEGINEQEVFVSVLFGVMLLLVVIQNNLWRFMDKHKENRYLSVLLVSTMCAIILDGVLFILDGKPGKFNHYLLFVGNTVLPAINVLLCSCLISFIMQYLVGNISKVHIRVLYLSLISTIVILVINAFNSMMFYINEQNQYVRGPYHDILFFIGIFLLLYFVCVYKYIVYKGGGLKFFPITAFVVPIIVGITLQMLNFGIALMLTTAAISITGVVLSLQNEMIFRDNLTGALNRYFWDNISSTIKKKHLFGLMFVDLNQFKKINDQYGHRVGDEVLKTTVEIMRQVANFSGTVIRYGGDEFIMLVNTEEEAEMEKYSQRLKEAFANYNAVSNNPYELSISTGYCITSLDSDKLTESLNKVDEKMYLDKEKSRYVNG